MLGKDLLKTAYSYLPKKEAQLVEKALSFATKYHEGQKRGSGEAFISHPIAVALPLAKLKFDYETICAALMHDVVEDTDATHADVKNEFGPQIASLVSGLTKLNKIKYKDSLEEYSVENLRKMFLAMAQDIRVVIIKLSDRLHNLQTLDGLSPKSQKRIAEESLEIYAPLASRLGIGNMKGALEDLAFKYTEPEEYTWTRETLEETVPRKERFLIEFSENLVEKLKEEDLQIIDAHGRVKRIYSLYKKLLRYEKNINRIYDLVAMRLIVPSIADCYKSLGIIHENYKPLIGRIKDYIATPKANGYQSLHTTVITPQGEIAEVQIRTLKMHHEAEYGIAAHWYYDDTRTKDSNGDNHLEKHNWIQQLAEWQQELQDNSEFKQSLKIDFFKDRIFVFTPLGEVLDLPDGATPIDFAYAIHTDIGHKCIGAKINGKLSTLDSLLSNGDMVEIMTSKQKSPSHDWLNFVKTNGAKTKIKAWFKKSHREKNLEDGKHILNRRLQHLKQLSIEKIKTSKKDQAAKLLDYTSFENALVSLGQGEISVDKIIKHLIPQEEVLVSQSKNKFIFFGKSQQTPRAIIEGERGILTNIARCCNPIPGDPIVAYITLNQGASIHKVDCNDLSQNKDSARIVNAAWDKTPSSLSTASIEIHCLDRVGMLNDISAVFTDLKANITNFSYRHKTKQDIVVLQASFEVNNVSYLLKIIEAIEKVDGVLKVIRT